MHIISWERAEGRPVRVGCYGGDLEGDHIRGVIFFSVGYGGSAKGYAYLGRGWSERGYKVFVVEHSGSNVQALKELRKELKDKQHLMDLVWQAVQDPVEQSERVQDLCSVVRYVCATDWYRESGLSGINLGGHSFGSFTVLKAFEEVTRIVPVMKLSIASPQPPGDILKSEDYARITVPILVATGTKDSADYIDGSSWEDRASVAPQLAVGSPWVGLVVFQDMAHLDFAGQGLNIRHRMSWYEQVSSSFWAADYQELSQTRIDAIIGEGNALWRCWNKD